MVLNNKFLLIACPEGNIRTKEDADEGHFAEIRAEIDERFKNVLHNEEKTVGDKSSKEKVEHVDFKGDLVPHNVSSVVTNCVQLSKNSINRP